MFYVEMSGQALVPTNILYAMTSQWREEKGEREIGKGPGWLKGRGRRGERDRKGGEGERKEVF